MSAQIVDSYFAPIAKDDIIDAQSHPTVSGNVLIDNGNGEDFDYIGTLSVASQTLVTTYGGTAQISTDGSFTYAGPSHYSGSDNFTYTITDSLTHLSDIGTVFVSNILVPNRPPLGIDDSFNAQGETIAHGNVLTNDTDPDGDALTVQAQSFTTENGGQVVLNSDGSFTYQAADGFRGGTDTFDYTVQDSYGGQSTASVTIANLFISHAPVAQEDILSADNGATASGNVLTNDSDPDGDSISAIAQTLTTAHGGTATVGADGTFDYQAAAGFRGTDTVNYTVQDSFGVQSTGTVTINDVFTNRGPIAVGDNIDADHQDTVSGNVLTDNGNGADFDPDVDVLTVQPTTVNTAHGATR